MTPKPAFRDIEQLSAYIDGHLKPSEIAKLETRLQSDIELATALKKLREARNTLRHLPQRNVPRNFILTREMVGLNPPMPQAYPIFRLASVLATLLFIFTFATNFMAPYFFQPSHYILVSTEIPSENNAISTVGVEDSERVMEAAPKGETAPMDQADAVQPAPAVEEFAAPEISLSPAPTEGSAVGGGLDQPDALPDISAEPVPTGEVLTAPLPIPTSAALESVNELKDDAGIEATPQPSEKSGVIPGELYAQKVPEQERAPDVQEIPAIEPKVPISASLQILLAGIAVLCAVIAISLRYFAIRKWRVKTK